MLWHMTPTRSDAGSPTEENAPVWDARTLNDPHGRSDKAARVERMFDAIAPTYERVNRVASFGRDAVWRRAAVNAASMAVRPAAVSLSLSTAKYSGNDRGASAGHRAVITPGPEGDT